MTHSATPNGIHGEPSSVKQILDEANEFLEGGRADQAEKTLERALLLAPDDSEVHRMMGLVSLMVGHGSKAIRHLRYAHAACADDATINMTLGSALFETGNTEEGLKYLQRTCELAPHASAAWYNYGRALQMTHRIEAAQNALERAVDIEPGSIQARNTLATNLISLGNTTQAAALLRENLRRQPDCASTWYVLDNLKTERFTAEDVSMLTRFFRNQEADDESRVMLGFSLARALEDQRRFDEAYDILQEANALKRRYVTWDRLVERQRVDSIAKAFTTTKFEPMDSTLGSEIIFIVCLPRSGSTLTEQILASHPDVEGGDEIQVLNDVIDEESSRRGRQFPGWVAEATAMDWQRMGQSYLSRTRFLRQTRPYSTDKSVNNWALAGAALAMLPGARVVNSRRDPLETCFACYRQLFSVGCDYTYDLDDMVSYYSGYEKLSTLWSRQYPDNYFDHHYESLQNATENQIRRLLEFCKLDFNPSCLDYYQTQRTVRTLSSSQVREPIRKNTARSESYGAKLDLLRNKLRADDAQDVV